MNPDNVTSVEPGAAWPRDILRCPVCRGRLDDGFDPQGAPELRCAQDCGEPGVRRGYRIEDGIPVLLADEARLVRD